MSSFITGGELAKRANTSRSVVLTYLEHNLIESVGRGKWNARIYPVESVAILKKMLRKKIRKDRFTVLKYLLDNNKL